MKIHLKKFGTTLFSRQLGKEAYNAFLPTLMNAKKSEKIEVDFDGVTTFSPSWGDEFLTKLMNDFKGRVILKKSENLSVQTTLQMLEEIYGYKFIVKEFE